MKAMLGMKKIDVAALQAAAGIELDLERIRSADEASRGWASGASGGGACRPCPACGARRAPTGGASRCSRARSASGWFPWRDVRRDVQKSVSASSPSVVTAASMRALNRRVDSPSIGCQRRAEHDLGLARLGPLHALAVDRPGAVDEHRHDRGAGTRRQVGGAALELLPPAIG